MKGKFDDILQKNGKEKTKDTKIKPVKFGARVRKITSKNSVVEEESIERLKELWKNKKIVTRKIIFWKSMEIDPNLYGGVISVHHIGKLNNWFYYGFVKKFKLSLHKILSVDQKLPLDWEQNMVDLRERVSARQMASKSLYGTTLIPSVRDEYYVNTYHVPF